TGHDVKNNSLTGADIKNIRGGDIAGRTIQCRNLATSVQKALTACNGGKTVLGANGSVTVNAPKGDKGAPGAPGVNGVNGTAGQNAFAGAYYAVAKYDVGDTNA